MREGDSMEKSEERNKIISELQTVIKEQVELKEIEIPGTITFQVMSVDGGNVPAKKGGKAGTPFKLFIERNERTARI